MTETEQEHAQMIDFHNERMKKLEKRMDELAETLFFAMRMMSNYMDKLEDSDYEQ
jgi:hypothetical protein